jgi:hypothetical protein
MVQNAGGDLSPSLIIKRRGSSVIGPVGLPAEVSVPIRGPTALSQRFEPQERGSKLKKIIDQLRKNEANKPNEVWNQAIYL